MEKQVIDGIIIGKNIKKYRLAYGLSQQELADMVGIGQSALAAYERGDRTPKIDMVLQLASSLNVDPFVIYGLKKTDEEKEKEFIDFVMNSPDILLSDSEDQKISLELPEKFEELFIRKIELEKVKRAKVKYEPGSQLYDMCDRTIELTQFWVDSWPAYSLHHRMPKGIVKGSDEWNMLANEIDNQLAMDYNALRKAMEK